MAVDVRFLGHSAFELSDGSTTLLVDPFLTGNPKAAVAADAVEADVILLSHGHGDHLGDCVAIARRTGAPVVAIVETAREIAAEGVETHGPNLGGTIRFDWGWVKLTPAWHTSTTPSGTVALAAGLLISFAGRTIYHLGDTALFGDLGLVGRRGQRIDLALVPIGGHFTMDRFDAVTAVELIAPHQVIPCHYDTFPAIETDAEAFRRDVQDAGFAEVILLEPGATHRLR